MTKTTTARIASIALALLGGGAWAAQPSFNWEIGAKAKKGLSGAKAQVN